MSFCYIVISSSVFYQIYSSWSPSSGRLNLGNSEYDASVLFKCLKRNEDPSLNKMKAICMEFLGSNVSKFEIMAKQMVHLLLAVFLMYSFSHHLEMFFVHI